MNYTRPDGRVVSVSFNERGYRGQVMEKARQPNVRRVAVLGDSYTEALAVDWQDAFPSQMERRLRDAIGPSEVLGLGTSSYGSVHEFLVLREEALSYAPDLVVLQMCVNDFWDNVRQLSYQRRGPWASLPTPDGPVTVTPPSSTPDGSVPNPVPYWRRIASELKWTSAIGYRVALLADPAWNAPSSLGPPAEDRGEAPGSLAVTDPRRDLRFRLAKRVTHLLVREMSHLCLRNGVRFAVYINPSTLRFLALGAESPYLANGLTERFRLDAAVEEWLLNDVLDYCREQGIDCVWSRDLFESSVASGLSVTVPGDPHWNEEGHRQVAADLAGLAATWLAD